MLVKDLIKMLEKLVEDHEPNKHIMGECEIMIDVFDLVPPEYEKIEYKGISPEICIRYSRDGVYPIISQVER